MTIDLIPVEILCRRAGMSLRRYYQLVQEGRAPAPVKGVPAPLARAWLDSRGVSAPLPVGDFVRATALCELADIDPTNYYVQVRKNKAPRQLKGILKEQAEEWLRNRAAARQQAVVEEGK